MCKAIEERIKESNEKVREECLAESREREKESVIEAFKGLVRDGLLSPEEAASRAGVPASVFAKESSGLDNMDVF